MKLHLTAILITHDLSVIAETCDRVAVMYAGKIMEQADTVSLYQHPMKTGIFPYILKLGLILYLKENVHYPFFMY